MADAGLELNRRKTRIVAGSDAASQHENTLASVYHPERDPQGEVRANLRRVFEGAVSDPVGRRRDLRFALSRLARENDDVAVPFAIQALSKHPWEAPRVVAYLAHFKRTEEVATAIDRNLRTAADANNEWLVGRVAPLAFDVPLSNATIAALENCLQDLASTASWGTLLRLIAHNGRSATVRKAVEQQPRDPRAALAAFADLGEPAPASLRKAEPVLSELLRAAPARLPSVERCSSAHLAHRGSQPLVV